MDIYVYSDESGVLDKEHEQFYVFGGVLFLSKETKEAENRKYIHVEKSLRKNNPNYKNIEMKGNTLTNRDKGKLFRSLNSCIKFGVVITQSLLLDSIFNHKKTKQRYLDFAYKLCLKRTFERLIKTNVINPDEVRNIIVFADEHTTATNGLYELREGLEEEFKHGTHNFTNNVFFPPIFPNLNQVQLSYRESKNTPLIRAADIVANRIYYHANTNKLKNIDNKIHLSFLPKQSND